MSTLLTQTDQTTCYDQSGHSVLCKGSGQDAEHKKINVASGHRFIVRKAIVEDTLSGLIWLKSPENLSKFPLSWQEAHEAVNQKHTIGYKMANQWRLPTRSELFSLVSHQMINPALPSGHLFENIFPGYYWTGTTCARLPNQAWYIHMGGARVQRGMKHGAYMVWPVCGLPQVYPDIDDKRFEHFGNSVKDHYTNLVWYQPEKGPVGRICDWPSALHTIADMNRNKIDSSSNWRLPNIRELESLIDTRTHSPALPKEHPFANVSDGYWSSTTSVYNPAYAWILYMIDGAIGVGYKPDATFYTWPVRWDYGN